MSITCSPPVTAADGTFSAAGIAAWNAGFTWGGSDASFASGVLTIGGSTAGAGIVVTGGTITASSPGLNITQTWNNAGTVFNAAVINVTANAFGATSAWLDLQLSGTSALKIYDSSGLGILKWTAGNSFLYNDGSKFNVGAGLSVDNSSGLISFSSDTTVSRISAGLVGIGTSGGGAFAARAKLTSVIHAGVAIASLNASPTIGEVQSVTDATAPAIGSTVASGGSAKALVWWNGANWTVIGV